MNKAKILLVEQYRIPVHARTIELPAGIIGDEPGKAGEGHAEAARRELLEETGYEAENVKALTTGPACSGIRKTKRPLSSGPSLGLQNQAAYASNMIRSAVIMT